ncbi:MAG: hypothetical protein RSG55_07620, partial [Oscillospiraceae bacterium]
PAQLRGAGYFFGYGWDEGRKTGDEGVRAQRARGVGQGNGGARGKGDVKMPCAKSAGHYTDN